MPFTKANFQVRTAPGLTRQLEKLKAMEELRDEYQSLTHDEDEDVYTFPAEMNRQMRPNIPMPLICCPSPMMTEICMPTQMAKAMDDALDGGLKQKDKTKARRSKD